MKGNDTKRQILLSYYQSEEPIDKITLRRTKQKPISDISEQDKEELMQLPNDKGE